MHDLIATHAAAEAAAGDWSAVAAILSAETIDADVKTVLTFGELSRLFPAVLAGEAWKSEADLILESLQTSIIPRARAAGALLTTKGVDMWRADVQALIPVLAAEKSWPADLAARLAALGRTKTSLAGGAVTAEECRVAFESHALRVEWEALWNEHLSEPMTDGDRDGFMIGLENLLAAMEG